MRFHLVVSEGGELFRNGRSGLEDDLLEHRGVFEAYALRFIYEASIVGRSR